MSKFSQVARVTGVEPMGSYLLWGTIYITLSPMHTVHTMQAHLWVPPGLRTWSARCGPDPSLRLPLRQAPFVWCTVCATPNASLAPGLAQECSVGFVERSPGPILSRGQPVALRSLCP